MRTLGLAAALVGGVRRTDFHNVEIVFMEVLEIECVGQKNTGNGKTKRANNNAFPRDLLRIRFTRVRGRSAAPGPRIPCG